MIHILWDLLLGALSGWIAAKLMKVDSSNIILNCVLGICGSLVFSLIAGLFGLASTNILGHVIFGVCGACLLVYVYNKFIKK